MLLTLETICTETASIYLSCSASNTRPYALWSNIKAISAGKDYLVGLRKDGTVVAEGVNDRGQGIRQIINGIQSDGDRVGYNADHRLKTRQ